MRSIGLYPTYEEQQIIDINKKLDLLVKLTQPPIIKKSPLTDFLHNNRHNYNKKRSS